MKKRRRDPAEKKALSYAKDRRNSYGENDKSSRKNIRRKKRVPNRADRRREHQTLNGAAGTLIDPLGELVEERLLSRRPKLAGAGRLKWPDQPLGEYLEDRLHRRAGLGISDASAVEVAIGKIRSKQGGRKGG